MSFLLPLVMLFLLGPSYPLSFYSNLIFPSRHTHFTPPCLSLPLWVQLHLLGGREIEALLTGQLPHHDGIVLRDGDELMEAAERVNLDNWGATLCCSTDLNTWLAIAKSQG